MYIKDYTLSRETIAELEKFHRNLSYFFVSSKLHYVNSCKLCGISGIGFWGVGNFIPFWPIKAGSIPVFHQKNTEVLVTRYRATDSGSDIGDSPNFLKTK
jgi:hypothetical protein